MVKVLRISITIWTNQWNWSYKLHHYENLVSYYKFCFKNTYKIKYVTIIRNSATAMNLFGGECSKIQFFQMTKPMKLSWWSIINSINTKKKNRISLGMLTVTRFYSKVFFILISVPGEAKRALMAQNSSN